MLGVGFSIFLRRGGRKSVKMDTARNKAMSHPHFSRNKSFYFHPLEVAFVGAAHSGKTDLIGQIVEQLSRQYKIGYIRQETDASAILKEGTDAARVQKNGATAVLTIGAERCSLVCLGGPDGAGYHQLVLENDFVFIEGYADSNIPKIIFVDKDGQVLKGQGGKPLSNIVACVGDSTHKDKIAVDAHYFNRQDVDGIQRHILSAFENHIKGIPLYGLVLAGGKSTRMKKDKSLLEYRGKKQAVYCFELLSQFCDQVFISNRQGQAFWDGHKTLPQIHDTFLEVGPLGGILTAMTKFPEAAWLVLACDLPFVDESVLDMLVRQRDPFKMATAYRSVRDHPLPEPLCAIYEPKAVFRFLFFLAQGIDCPRHILARSDIHALEPGREFSLDNVNSPEEYQKAVEWISKGLSSAKGRDIGGAEVD